MAMKPGYFSFNGLDSEEHHIFIQDRPDIVAPKRRVSFIAPNAFEGELAYDDDGYEPTEFELKCFYDGRKHKDNHIALSDARNDIYTFFNQGVGEWVVFIPYFDENHEYMVILTELTFENKYYYEGCISFTAKLKCQPYKYVRNSPEINVSNGYLLTNPTQYIARPLVSFTGVYGQLDIRIGDRTLSLRNLNRENIYIDCETYSVYAKDRSLITNFNNKTIGKDFFFLYPCKDPRNRLTITKPDGAAPQLIKLKPNWRVLV